MKTGFEPAVEADCSNSLLEEKCGLLKNNFF
jgi:hypothetical protein